MTILHSYPYNMLLRIFHFILKTLSKIINKKILYTSFESLIPHNQMAIFNPVGFWYVGNLYDSSDIAYWIANNSSIIDEGNFVNYILGQVLISKLEKQIIFYDIWANTGYFGILAKTLAKVHVETHFFEPLKVHTDCINQSIYLNRLEEGSYIHEIGLGKENAQMTFYIAWSWSTLLSEFSGSEITWTCTIDVRNLSQYQKEESFWIPDFVKIDVEGNEYDVILWGLSLFEEVKPVLYVEIAKDLKNIWRDFINKNFDDIFISLQNIGYTSFCVSDDYKSVSKFLPWQENSGVHMYLFLHPIKHTHIISQYEN